LAKKLLKEPRRRSSRTGRCWKLISAAHKPELS
jgi:hypothetical protein